MVIIIVTKVCSSQVPDCFSYSTVGGSFESIVGIECCSLLDLARFAKIGSDLEWTSTSFFTQRIQRRMLRTSVNLA